MFKSLKRITYQVADIDGARKWYGGILDAQPVFDSPFAVDFKVRDCSLSLVQGKQSLPENNRRVEVYWEVGDIETAYRRLIDAGAQSHSPVRTVLNIRIAQVIDPFGNVIGITGPAPDAKGRSVETQPSDTALTVAFCRALAAKDERAEIRGPDHLAELFLTEDGRKPLTDGVSRRWAIQKLVTSPLYGYLIARTAYIDSLFKKSLADNIPQIVFLGAGYDTRAYRYCELIQSTRIFELDIHSTQKRKLEILRDAKIAIPKQLSFVSVNFKVDGLEDVLSRTGFNATAETLFIWEGVTYYLTEEAVKNTLVYLRTHSPPGSAVCLDYMTRKVESVNAAEPFQFWIERDKVERFLAEHGIKILEHMDSNEMEKRFLTLSDGSLAETVLAPFCLVYAAVNR